MKTIILSVIASLSASAALAGSVVYSIITPTVDNSASDGAGVVLVLLAIGAIMLLGNNAPQQRAKSPEVEADDDDIIMKF